LSVKGKPDQALYEVRREMLGLLEEQSEAGHIDLFYGDESQVAESGYVPYGWVFKDENVSIAAQKGKSINIFGLLCRDNRLVFDTCEHTITSEFVWQKLDEFSLQIQKPTVVVLDNARIHTAHKIKERLAVWQKRGLFIFYLPPYSPHLNIIERLWKELKARWLKPADYLTTQDLFFAVWANLITLGAELTINFSKFNDN
jgi:transposase